MQEEIEIDIWGIVNHLLRKWKYITGAVIAAICIVFCASSLFTKPVYESQSMLYITTKEAEGSVVQNMLSSLQAGNALTADYKTLAVSKPVLEQVIEELKLDTTYAELKKNVSTMNPDNTRILTLKVRDEDPKEAKRIVDKLTTVERQKIADVMDMSKPNVLQWGDITAKPVSSSPARNAGIAGILMLLIVSGYYAVKFILNDRIVTAEDIEENLEVKNLAGVPVIPELEKNVKSGGKKDVRIGSSIKRWWKELTSNTNGGSKDGSEKKHK